MNLDKGLGFIERIAEIFLLVCSFILNNILWIGLLIIIFFLFKLYFEHKKKKRKKTKLQNEASQNMIQE